MRKWEHDIITDGYWRHHSIAESEMIKEKEEKGWELCAVVHDWRDEKMTYYWKREIVEVEKDAQEQNIDRINTARKLNQNG